MDEHAQSKTYANGVTKYAARTKISVIRIV